MLKIDVVILAGGMGRRMGGLDKGLVEFRQLPMIAHTINVVRPLVSRVILSCNRNLDEYQKLADIVVVDPLEGFQGPLAGILAGLSECKSDHLLVLPCDTPLLEMELIAKLLQSAEQSPNAISVLSEGTYLHPLHAVVPVSLKADLELWLEGEQRAVQRWMRQYPLQTIDIGSSSEQLVNLNTKDDLNLKQ